MWFQFWGLQIKDGPVKHHQKSWNFQLEKTQCQEFQSNGLLCYVTKDAHADTSTHQHNSAARTATKIPTCGKAVRPRTKIATASYSKISHIKTWFVNWSLKDLPFISSEISNRWPFVACQSPTKKRSNGLLVWKLTLCTLTGFFIKMRWWNLSYLRACIQQQQCWASLKTHVTNWVEPFSPVLVICRHISANFIETSGDRKPCVGQVRLARVARCSVFGIYVKNRHVLIEEAWWLSICWELTWNGWLPVFLDYYQCLQMGWTQEVSNCSELKHLCDLPEARLLRMVCGSTCGCTDPLSQPFHKVGTSVFMGKTGRL